MKWLLLVLVVTSDPTVRISVERMVEIETEKLCKEAAIVVSESVKGSSQAGIIGKCIKVRE